jgi:DNA mismatch repair protein MutS2
MKSRREIDQTRAKVSDAFNLASNRLESALEEEAPEIAEALALGAAPAPAAPERPKLEVGTQVRIPKWKSVGTVIELSGPKVKVTMGKMQMSLSLDDIEPLAASEIAALPKPPAPRPRTSGIGIGDVPTPPSQLDLRGVRFDDAMSQLEQYLDQAFRSGGLAEVTIVHGLGTGAIREGTRKLLRTLPYVKEFRDAGSSGATLVEFDR